MESKSPSQSEFQTGAAIVFQIYQTPPRTVCVCVTVTAATYRTLALKLNCEVNHSHLTVMRISPAECLVN